eukprot:jgi/Chlat1/579/Chrsp103S01008
MLDSAAVCRGAKECVALLPAQQQQIQATRRYLDTHQGDLEWNRLLLVRGFAHKAWRLPVRGGEIMARLPRMLLSSSLLQCLDQAPAQSQAQSMTQPRQPLTRAQCSQQADGALVSTASFVGVAWRGVIAVNSLPCGVVRWELRALRLLIQQERLYCHNTILSHKSDRKAGAGGADDRSHAPPAQQCAIRPRTLPKALVPISP